MEDLDKKVVFDEKQLRSYIEFFLSNKATYITHLMDEKKEAKENSENNDFVQEKNERRSSKKSDQRKSNFYTRNDSVRTSQKMKRISDIKFNKIDRIRES